MWHTQQLWIKFIKHNSSRSSIWIQESLSYLGSSCFVAPRPYNGMTLSLLIAALQTGQTCLVGLVSSHWCKHGQLQFYYSYYNDCQVFFILCSIYQIRWNTYQNRWPHILTTASLAVSRQMLHSNILSSFSFSFSSADPDGFEGPASSLVLIFCVSCVSIAYNQHLKPYNTNNQENYKF